MATNSHTYRIDRVQVYGLWGRRDLDLSFDPSVNILIGPNASGKTTILNIIYHAFSGNFIQLAEIDFVGLEVSLQSFEGESTRTVTVKYHDDTFHVDIWRQSYSFQPPPPGSRRRTRRRRGRSVPDEMEAAAEHLQDLVPAVWLPVTRRLPVSEQDGERFYRPGDRPPRPGRLESVDQKLTELLDELSRYRLQLESRLSARYKDFEKNVLQLILFNKEQDSELMIGPPPSEDDKEQLVSAFEEAGLLDDEMRHRITDHFSAANAAYRKLTEDEGLEDWADIAVMPLIWRTKQMVTYAQRLDDDREDLFTPLHRYESLVNSFLIGKTISVDSDGDFIINADGEETTRLDPRALSSGEKQILILLTQALLKEGEPVVYVADEPELSLHVNWQEKLLDSLLELGQQIQIVVATHSPDIVADFVDNVIQLETPAS